MKKRFYLDKEEGKVFGVCAGIANHMNWDPTFVRVAMVVLTLITFPWALLVYGVAAMIGKKRPVDGYGEAALDRPLRTSTYELNRSMRDIDRRMAEIETYVTAQNTPLAREIESLR
ncbi:MAG TPA: PspC domain-containing protein [Allosphingosinicella sp.]|jgi:phage shock protein C